MPRTILIVVNEALAIARLPTVNTLAGTGTRETGLRALSNKTIAELRRDKFWPVLWADGTINVVNGTSSYATPADFDCMVPDTMYPDTGCKIVGADTPAQVKAGENYMSLRVYPHFTIKGRDKDIVLSPTPTADETYTYVYKSMFAVSAADDTAKQHVENDDDYLIIDEELFQLGFIWRYKHSLGHEYGEDFNSYERAVAQRYAQEIVAPTIPVGNPTYDPITDGYVQENNFG